MHIPTLIGEVVNVLGAKTDVDVAHARTLTMHVVGWSLLLIVVHTLSHLFFNPVAISSIDSGTICSR